MWRAPYREGTNKWCSRNQSCVREGDWTARSEKIQGRRDACQEDLWRWHGCWAPVPRPQEASEQPFLGGGEMKPKSCTVYNESASLWFWNGVHSVASSGGTGGEEIVMPVIFCVLCSRWTLAEKGCPKEKVTFILQGSAVRFMFSFHYTTEDAGP